MSRAVHPFGRSGARFLAHNVSWLQRFVTSFRYEGEAETVRRPPCHTRLSKLRHARQTEIITSYAAAEQESANLPEQNSSSFCSSRSNVVVPLAERPGKVVATSTQVLEWRDWARTRAASAGWRREGSDNDCSPTLESLFTEVDWIVEDAVAGVSDAVSGSHVDDIAWRDMGRLREGHGLPHGGQVLLREELDDLRGMWTTRLRDRVPVQYITASCHWRDLLLVVTPAVLIPRPETELMVDFVIDALKQMPELADAPWVDLGTGSGALAISVATEIHKMKYPIDSTWRKAEDDCDPLVHAVDLSSDAIAIARHNARRNKVATGGGTRGVRFHEGSWYEPLKDIIQARGAAKDIDAVRCFGGIVSNPPYIPSENMHDLQPEVRKHEPWLALEGGTGPGLDALTPICEGAAALLLPGGFLALETNGGAQAHKVANLLRRMRKADAYLSSISPEARVKGQNDDVTIFENIQIRKDYCGVERFVTASRRKDGPCF